jgi:ABC-type polysaccharide/polyol phosphate export permease
MTTVESGRLVGGRAPGLPERLIGHVDVMIALGRREIQSRFGENALGYAWTYVAPLAWIAATYFAFMLFARTSPVFTDTVTFIISGLIPYLAFRYVITAIGRSTVTVRGLLIFPNVTEEHAIATAALIEFVNIFVVYAVVALVNYLAFGNGELYNPLLFVAGVALAWGLGVAYAYLFAALGRIDATFTQIGPVLLRPAFFVSGIFFTANELPDAFLDVLWWNPLLHAVEIARDGMLFHYQSRIASPAYVLLWIGGLFAAGFFIDVVRRR